jgi:RNA polymerase sigma-70 factor (ECF subfamily)
MFVQAQCGDRAVAELVVRETLLAARAAWPWIGSYTKPIGWLLKTARGKLVEAMGPEISTGAYTWRRRAVHPTGIRDLVAAGDAGAAFLELMVRLPAEYAEICVLDWFQFSDPEIVRLLDVTPASVAEQRSEARRRLRALIDDDLVEVERRRGER